MHTGCTFVVGIVGIAVQHRPVLHGHEISTEAPHRVVELADGAPQRFAEVLLLPSAVLLHDEREPRHVPAHDAHDLEVTKGPGKRAHIVFVLQEEVFEKHDNHLEHDEIACSQRMVDLVTVPPRLQSRERPAHKPPPPTGTPEGCGAHAHNFAALTFTQQTYIC